MSDSFAALRQKFAWEEPSESWYVPRDESFLEEIVSELSAGRDRGVVWVTAPSGAGLSTQLARLSEVLAAKSWRPVRISLLGRAEPGRAIGPTAMAMVSVFWLLRSLPEGKHRLDSSADRATHRLIEALRTLCMMPGQRTQTDWVNAFGQALFFTIQRLKDPTFREQIETDPNIPIADWAEVITALTKLLGQQSELVVIVDDVNELDLGDSADRLLPRVASLWQNLPARVVMSYPRRLDYSKEFAFATSGDPRVALRPLPRAGRVDFHRELLKRRLPNIEFEGGLVAQADELALGNTSEFLELLAGALRVAHSRGEALTSAHIVASGKRRGQELRRLIAGGGALRQLAGGADGEHLEELAPGWLGLRALLEVGDEAVLKIHPGLAAELSATGTQD